MLRGQQLVQFSNVKFYPGTSPGLRVKSWVSREHGGKSYHSVCHKDFIPDSYETGNIVFGTFWPNCPSASYSGFMI